jgi:large subunit ribosomal protein L27
MMNPEKTTLVALCDGTVKVTCEAFDPNFDHPLVVEHYSQRKGTMYKKYFHVIPDPQHNRFKLIDVV